MKNGAEIRNFYIMQLRLILKRDIGNHILNVYTKYINKPLYIIFSRGI